MIAPTIIDNIGKNEDVKVSIVCITYNHRSYIERTLDNFINQKTNFDFEIIVHDDNSNDGTKEIIIEYTKKYPKLIRAILENENLYSQSIDFRTLYITPLINGKYVAGCEGDDYWPSLDKIQLQYDFLENNKEYIAVGGITDYITDKEDFVLPSQPHKKYVNKEMTYKTYYNNKNIIVSLNTIMSYKQLYSNDKYIQAKKESPKIGDSLFMANIFENGRLFVMDKVFQKHIIQTRDNSSNFNTIFSQKQKYIYKIQAINSLKNFTIEFNRAAMLREHTTLYFCYCLIHLELKDFFECRKMIYPEYKENLMICLIKSFSSILSYLLRF